MLTDETYDDHDRFSSASLNPDEATVGDEMADGPRIVLVRKEDIPVLIRTMARGRHPFERNARYVVEGDLDLSGLHIKAMPFDLEVQGALTAVGSRLGHHMPRRLRTAGTLNLSKSDVSILPDDIAVGGPLLLADTTVAALPAALTVLKAGCDLSRTPIRTLPEGFTVRGRALLRGMPNLSVLPRGMRILNHPKEKAHLDVAETTVSELPESYENRGGLDISRTPFRRLRAGMRVRGPFIAKGSALEAIEDGVTFNGPICIADTMVETLPPSVEAPFGLDARGSRLSSLRDDFWVRQYLLVGSTPMRTLPGVRVAKIDASDTLIETLHPDLRANELILRNTRVPALPLGCDSLTLDLRGTTITEIPASSPADKVDFDGQELPIRSRPVVRFVAKNGVLSVKNERGRVLAWPSTGGDRAAAAQELADRWLPAMREARAAAMAADDDARRLYRFPGQAGRGPTLVARNLGEALSHWIHIGCDLRDASFDRLRPLGPLPLAGVAFSKMGDGSFKDCDLTDQDLSGADLSGILIQDSSLAFARLGAADLRSLRLKGASLFGADLRAPDPRASGADCTRMEADRVSFERILADEVSFEDAVFLDCSFEAASLDRASFLRAKLRRANLAGVFARNADMRMTDLRGADLRGAILTGTKFLGSDLSNADLRGADLTGCNLTGCNLTGCDLRGAKLDGAIFNDATLRNARLSSDHVSKASFRNADCVGMTLICTTADECDFSGADLAEANVRLSRFVGCDFTDAKFGCGGQAMDTLATTFHLCHYDGADIAAYPAMRFDRNLNAVVKATGRALVGGVVTGAVIGSFALAGSLGLFGGTGFEEFAKEFVQKAAHNATVAMIAVPAVAWLKDKGTEYLRDKAEDNFGEAIEGGYANMRRSTMGFMSRLQIKASDLSHYVSVFLSNTHHRDMLTRALSAVGKKDNGLGRFLALPSALGHVVFCHCSALRHAADLLRDFKAGPGDGHFGRLDGDIVLVGESEGGAAPSVVILHPDGRSSAVWTQGGKVADKVTYGRDGAPLSRHLRRNGELVEAGPDDETPPTRDKVFTLFANPPMTVSAENDGLWLKTWELGSRTKKVWVDRQDACVGMIVTETATGREVVNQGLWGNETTAEAATEAYRTAGAGR